MEETKKKLLPEQLIQHQFALNLQKSLHLSDSQIAKGNTAFLRLCSDPKLSGASQISMLNASYRVSLLDYQSDNAVAFIKYGNDVQIQLQYQGYLEDLFATGQFEIENVGVVPVYAEVDYKAYVDEYGQRILTIPQIQLSNPFQALTIIGYYAFAKSNSGRMFTCLKSIEELKNWASRYSISQKAYLNKKASSSIWESNFETMAMKTCIKSVCREVLKYYPNDRLKKSITLDQAVVGENEISYKDNPNTVQVVDLTEKNGNVETDLFGEEEKE